MPLSLLNSAYGIRLGLSAGVRRCAPRASFLGSLFTAYRRFTPVFAGVAVRIAVQANLRLTRFCGTPKPSG